jgi:soluble lytic murein transglycosylase-like protein
MRRLALASLLLAASFGLAGCSWLADEPPSEPVVVAPRAQQVSTRWLPPTVTRFAPTINAAAQRHGVDANLLAIVVLVESGGDPTARGPAGERGLMQLTPALAASIAGQRGIITHNELRLMNPAYNLDLGAWYLARQLARFWTGHPDHSVDRAVAAYAGGPDLVARGGVLPAPTRRYMQFVGGMWRERFQARSPTYEAWFQSGGRVLVDRARSVVAPPTLPPGPMLLEDATPLQPDA